MKLIKIHINIHFGRRLWVDSKLGASLTTVGSLLVRTDWVNITTLKDACTVMFTLDIKLNMLYFTKRTRQSSILKKMQVESILHSIVSHVVWDRGRTEWVNITTSKEARYATTERCLFPRRATKWILMTLWVPGWFAEKLASFHRFIAPYRLGNGGDED